MRIVALTDIHGAYERAERILRAEMPDVLIIGGDLTTIGTVREAEEALRRFLSLVPRTVCVAGNMDLPQHDELFEKLEISINGRGRIIDEVGFHGVSAAPHSKMQTPYELSEEEIARKAKEGHRAVSLCSTRIFVPHAPPYGSRVDIIHAGIHVGSTAVRDFIEELQPDIVVCGHIHEARGQDLIDRSRIVNCGPASNGCYAVIEISTENRVENKQLP